MYFVQFQAVYRVHFSDRQQNMPKERESEREREREKNVVEIMVFSYGPELRYSVRDPSTTSSMTHHPLPKRRTKA